MTEKGERETNQPDILEQEPFRVGNTGLDEFAPCSLGNLSGIREIELNRLVLVRSRQE